MHQQPIIQGDPPLKPVRDMDHFGIPLPAAAVWSALEYAGVQDVRGLAAWAFCHGFPHNATGMRARRRPLR
jgi:hypothetical protein